MYSHLPQIENLERQTSRDAATITKLNSDLRKFSTTQKENNSDIGKLTKEVHVLVYLQCDMLWGVHTYSIIIMYFMLLLGMPLICTQDLILLSLVKSSFFSSFLPCLQIELLNGQLRAKDEELARLRQLHSEEVARLSEELRSLRDSYEAKIREYEELMDVKIQLDQEIATYRALLQEEETRFVSSESI